MGDDLERLAETGALALGQGQVVAGAVVDEPVLLRYKFETGKPLVYRSEVSATRLNALSMISASFALTSVSFQKNCCRPCTHSK